MINASIDTSITNRSERLSLDIAFAENSILAPSWTLIIRGRCFCRLIINVWTLFHRENKFIVEKRKERRIVLARSNRSRFDFLDEYWQDYVIEFRYFYEREKFTFIIYIYYYLFIYIVILRLIEESPMEISTYSIVKYQNMSSFYHRWVYFVSSIIHAQHVTSNFTNSKKSQKTIFCNAKTILWWSLKRGQYLVDILLHYSQIFNHCQIECYSATCVL